MTIVDICYGFAQGMNIGVCRGINKLDCCTESSRQIRQSIVVKSEIKFDTGLYGTDD